MSESERVDVHGQITPGFEEVREEFTINLADRGDLGASLGVYVDGQLVVDLWGGVADPATDRAWDRDTVGLAFSVTKGATALVCHRLVEDGLLDLDAPVATYWPEFAAGGKAEITVLQLLSHQAGLPAPMTTPTRPEVLAAHTMAEALAEQTPTWPPGSAHGYHALTFGWLIGELVHRITGRSLGEVFAEHVAGPLNLDFWIGLPEDRAAQVAQLVDGVADPRELDAITDPGAKAAILAFLAQASDPTSLFSRTLSTNGALPTPSAEVWNDPAVRAAQIPAANGITNGRSLARMYAAAVGEVDGVRLLRPETVERARAVQADGADAVLMSETRYGAGFQLPTPMSPLLSESSFGHLGAGGALGFADVDHAVGFGYVQNTLSASLLGDPRTPALIGALRRAIA